ncbi:hypothetical protein F441_01881 [Phytophthora nicotianae CJ01A1]|uniref:PX domain-containing protein n=5 Tax=Phytophthora nicotianae TaxID=4792 RepID=V9FXD3_PHYNI|nr:hypothetical protein F443_01919 [Phytophthora nicotianae P1569]ETK95209.1 hypothetical protein L915_01846 [Phytophthora nicotianae]ETO84136.1 hypothetical protein F444_01924 [Phytophthora nicotianae P1976]ETP25221.1 hypothetical protein F441_01881 [Phytophthora nicotianae CJ01A1]ETP53224.1 hypothetical protein F442_01856 [Phytophthora nicotianae P10297]
MTSPTTMTAPPAAPPKYNSFASRKRSSPAVKPLPEDVAWLKDIKLEMTTTNSIRAAVKYNLRVDYHPAGFTATHWDVKRTFDQYKAFQKRLVNQLQPKHSCKAECRWLYNTVKKHFPKPTLLGSHCPPIVDQRRKALLQLLMTVQASVVNHGNRNCKVMMEAVSQELAMFLVGDENRSADGVTPPVTPTTASELETPANSLPSFISSDEGEDEDEDTVNYDDDLFTGWSLPMEHLTLDRTMSSPV